MRTDLKYTLGRQATLVGVAAACTFAGASAHAAAPTTAPQVLLAITNSESMDGTTSGAIMVGSGSADSSLALSSSPVNFSLAAQSGFQPPINTGSGGVAPYTAACGPNGSYLCDNGPSRLNLAKAAISSVLGTYGNSLNFGIYDYSVSTPPTLYSTWVYYMSSGTNAFTFTNTASTTGGTVPNPCYHYTSYSAGVQADCAAIAGQYGSNVVQNNQYLVIGATSDNPQINDVLYSTSGEPAFLTYGGASPTTPYNPTGNANLPGYTLTTYNRHNSSFSEAYTATAPVINASQGYPNGYWSTTPTNAGYVPYSNQVLYAQRGFGYGSPSQDATTGNPQVAMGTDPASSTFTTALSPETNQTGSSEIKSVAGQSATYGLLNGALSYLQGLNPATCQSQYVVLLTDGLPTLDSAGYVWPPLGTTTASAVNFNVTASYAGDGTFASSNSQAVTDAISAITALNTAGIKVYIIGLGAGVDSRTNPSAASLLQAMAIAGGTHNYFAANSATALTAAFNTIVQQIYSQSAIAAPVAPISVAGGGAYEYNMISVLNPGAGHVYAYPVAANGTPAATSSWDAGALMNTSNRTAALRSTTTTKSIDLLANIDTAAFNLTTTTCVPDVATIIGYTINPNYSSSTHCSYLTGRQSAWYLGTFSTQDTGRYVGPPATALLAQRYPTYSAYAAGAATRAPAVMFTNADGFLYSIDASSGAINWGWTSRSLLGQLQNYASFPASGETDGNFTVADAMDSSNNWASYVVGSFQSGAEHFSLKLSSAGVPTSAVYDLSTSGGTSAGDVSGAAGATPLRQPPVIAYIGNNALAVYVVTVGSTSTLYETNIATGTSTSTVLSFKVSGALTFNASTNELYLGGADGTVRVLTLTSVTAATSILNLQTIGTTVNPANGNTVTNVLYVGYAQVDGAQYVYAVNSTELTVFYVTSTGWTPLWASTPTQGYTYGGTAWSTSSTVTTWTASSVASDIPLVINNALLLPVFVAGTNCNPGTGDYDLFNIVTGAFPTVTFTINGSPVTADISDGPGRAFTPSITVTSSGLSLNSGSAGTTDDSSQRMQMSVSNINKAISWRQH